MRRLAAALAISGISALALMAATSPLAAAAPKPRGCPRSTCTVSDDEMVYRITRPDTRFVDPVGQWVSTIRFSIKNLSRRTHVFEPLAGGFTVVKASGAVEQFTDYIGQASGTPGYCYDPSSIDPSGTDPSSYRLKPGQLLRGLNMCFVVTATQLLAKFRFADNDASRNAVIKIPRGHEKALVKKIFDCGGHHTEGGCFAPGSPSDGYERLR
jgi:hypothetical protein